MTLKAPFPWFGGKSRVADIVWAAFGKVSNYVEPFFGSGAVLLGRPQPFDGSETVNDKDGLLANFWRAIQQDAEEVAQYADWPVNENDLHARHSYLVNAKRNFVAKMEGDPYFYDAKIAGWWVWGICSWIGSGWCSGDGPWSTVDGKLVHLGNAGRGVSRKLVHLGDAGRGVNRQHVHLGNAGLGVNRQLVHLGDAGQGKDVVLEWFDALAKRLKRVRVCCGGWARICGSTPTVKLGLTGVFLDPPYSAERAEVYSVDDVRVAHDVRKWAIAHGEDPMMRIALCGYDGEHKMPEAWTEFAWKANGGYESQAKGKTSGNCNRERIWFSPHCMPLIAPQIAMLYEVAL